MAARDQRSGGKPLLCPSAQPGMANCQVLGVIGESNEGPRLSYLNQPLPATEQVLAMTGPVKAIEVFRLAATCEERKCTHFNGTNCKLATRIVQHLPPVVAALPPCVIRANCRWYQQEGREACLRCPQIVTLNYEPSERLKQAAGTAPVSIEAGA